MDDTIEIYTLENPRQEVINVAEKCEQSNQKSREAILRTKAKFNWNKMTLKEKVEFDKIDRADAAKDRANFAKKLADHTAKADKDRADFQAWMANLVPNTIKELDRVQNHLDVAINATNQIENTIEIYTLENPRQEVINVAEKCEQSNQKSREVILRTKAKFNWNKMTLEEKVEFDKIDRADAVKARADAAKEAAKARENEAKARAKADKDRADFHAWMANLVPNTIKELDRVQNDLDVAIIEKKEIKSTIPAHKSKMNQALQTGKKIARPLVNLLSKITYSWMISLFLISTEWIISLIKISACKIQEFFTRLVRFCGF